ncbi:MAG: feruloyl-CoA synthase [Rhodobacteraceae bacterium]|nr:feruloyl-CoA synthase [Paracoccaceae bacterium]
MTAYVKHLVEREDRADGAILLRSGLTLGPVARNSGEWLHRWADAAPDRVFIAERSGGGWREASYGATLSKVRAVAASLLARGMGPGKTIVALSGPGVDHGILTLAAQYIGAPIVPLAEQYSLIPDAYPRLIYTVGKIHPSMIYASNSDAFGPAMALPELAGIEKVVSYGAGDGYTDFVELLKGQPDAALDQAYAAIGPDTLAKILFTSGSTSHPKAVPQTQGMMTVNQAQYLACFPLLADRSPVMLDWMPWNHVFAGSSNFNMILSNGGTLYLDDGKPMPALFGRTLENLAMHPGTLSFNVPIAYSLLVTAMRKDTDLRRKFFADLDILFYAGASLSPEIWSALRDMAMAETGRIPMMTSCWGMTETAPAAILHYQGGAQTGMIGVPMPGLTVKLIPEQPGRYDLRVSGPNVMTGYIDDPEKNAESFDVEGFLISGDAVRFADPDDMTKGVRFDGRISEDFKLMSGSWVNADALRLGALTALSGLVQDVVVTGADKADLGLLVFPLARLVTLGDEGEIITNAAYCGQIRQCLADLSAKATGMSTRIRRALVMAEPPSIAAGEITAKGSLNNRVVLKRRTDMLAQLYDDDGDNMLKI